jgi:hypothetical protein
VQKLKRLKKRNRIKNKRFSLQQLEEAFSNGNITFVQFIEVIIDNFGKVHGKEILFTNLELSMKLDNLTEKECEDSRQSLNQFLESDP